MMGIADLEIEIKHSLLDLVALINHDICDINDKIIDFGVILKRQCLYPIHAEITLECDCVDTCYCYDQFVINIDEIRKRAAMFNLICKDIFEKTDLFYNNELIYNALQRLTDIFPFVYVCCNDAIMLLKPGVIYLKKILNEFEFMDSASDEIVNKIIAITDKNIRFH